MMKLTCILFALAVVGTYADEPEKMVNGIATSVEEYPHVITMQLNGNHFCGGSIISSRTILTAGHCVEPLIKDRQMAARIKICTGTTYLNQATNCYPISKLYLHENYQNTMGRPDGYDIGLIILGQPIQFNARQQPINLPSYDAYENEGVTIAAWGATGFRQPTHNNLQKLNALSMSAARCYQYHQQTTGMRIHSNEFCTLISQGTGMCNGDSGSGVIRNADRTIIGLVSGGIPCARGVPDVYTTVYRYLSWIQQRME